MRNIAVTLLLGFALATSAAAWQAGAGYPADQDQKQTGESPATSTQEPGATAGPQSGISSDEAEGNFIVGCLQSSTAKDNYTLQTRDQGDVQVMVKGDLKDEIGRHLGHEVRLTGEWEEAKDEKQIADNRDQADLPQSDEPQNGQQNEGQEFMADRVDMISQTCTQSGVQPPSQQTKPGPESQPQTLPETQPQQ